MAAQADLKILPWLSAKGWSDILAGSRAKLAKQWFGVEIPYGQEQDGTPAAPLIYDDAVLSAGSRPEAAPQMALIGWVAEALGKK